HWFKPDAAKAEFRRLLMPNGWIVVAWNDRDLDTPFATAYEDLLVKFGTDYKKVKDAYPEKTAMEQFFSGGSVNVRSLPNEQQFDLEGLIGRVRSSSYAPQEGHTNYEPMMAAIRDLFRANEKDGRVRMEYSTHVYYGRLGKQA